MQTAKQLLISSLILVLVAVSTSLVTAQNSVAREKRIKISKGQSKTIQGKTDSYTNYIYKLRAQKDQSLEARLTSEGGVASMSVIPPGTQSLENAAAVSQWSGVLPETGEYSIVVVMNTKDTTKVPYTLEVSIK